MGRWDRELVELLPESVKVYASAGAGFDWIDTACLADYGELDSRNQALGVAEQGKHWRVFRDTLLGLFDWIQTFVSLGELIFLQEPCIFFSLWSISGFHFQFLQASHAFQRA